MGKRTAAHKAWQHYHSRQQVARTPLSYLYVRVGSELRKVELVDILCVQAVDDYLNLYLTTGKPLLVRMTLKGLLERLPAADFIQVHRSYVVPLRQVTTVRRGQLVLGGSMEVPIGATYEAAFYAQLGR